ncbi:MAG: class I SAM-dependent methyltransferase [Pirellulaceae bacterium]
MWLACYSNRWSSTLRLVLVAGLVGYVGGAATLVAQEKSVRPGINDSFRDPVVDEWVGRFEVESRETFEKRQEIVATMKLKPGAVVADIGAGTGLFTRLFAAAVQPKGKVVAVDISQKFLDHIAASSQKAGLANVETVLGTAHSVELAPATIDVAFICDTYHHFEFPYRVMSSLHKALKPGGRVVVIDFIRIPGQSTDWVMSHVRAGQEEVETEITKTGFRKVGEVKDLLKQNYIVIFERTELAASGN